MLSKTQVLFIPLGHHPWCGFTLRLVARWLMAAIVSDIVSCTQGGKWNIFTCTRSKEFIIIFYLEYCNNLLTSFYLCNVVFSIPIIVHGTVDEVANMQIFPSDSLACRLKWFLITASKFLKGLKITLKHASY